MQERAEIIKIKLTRDELIAALDGNLDKLLMKALTRKWALEDTLEAMKRCPGVHTTDQVTGQTFSTLIDKALANAKGGRK